MATASDTKLKILEAAECLFAENGFAATSLRAITAAAGVNLAGVNYHFGSKEALLSTVLGRRFGIINRDRLRRLDEVEAAAVAGPPELEGVLRALLAPPFVIIPEWGEGGRKFIQMVGRMHSETNDRIRARFREQFDEIVGRFSAALGRALPSLAPAELSHRMHFVVGAMAHTMAWSQDLGMVPRPGHQPAAHGDLLDDLVAFAVAGMSAPAVAPKEAP